MRIALAHDYLNRFGGAERVLKELHALYPDAPIYTLTADQKVVDEHFPAAEVRTSFVDRLPVSHRTAFPLLPFAVESFDLRDFDVVLSSSSAFIKGLITRATTRHVSYCHTPPRYLWEDRLAYADRHLPRGMKALGKGALHLLRLWDQDSAHRVDSYVANSIYTRERLKRYYGTEAQIIHPPVDVGEHPMSSDRRQALGLPDEYFLLVGRITWWKRPELAVDAFSALGLPLFVVGEGPMKRALMRGAMGNVRFLGWQDDKTVRQLMHGAQALIHPSTEDFGITAVEAMAEGTPVVALAKGGALETVQEGVSGIFFEDADPLSLANAVRVLRERDWDRTAIRQSAQQYAPDRFRNQIRVAVEQ